MKLKKWQLKQRQSLSLDSKIKMSKRRIKQFYDEFQGNIYVAFSGGKDSTVLLDLVRSIYPNIKAVFCDTGLEYPEIKEFVKTIDNVKIIRPKKSFNKVIKEEGYPFPSKAIAYKVRQIRHPRNSNVATRHLYLTGIKNNGNESKYGKLPKKWEKLINAPFEVSEKCCNIMKKKPFKKYNRKTNTYPVIGTMANDSNMREYNYLKYGCNIFGDEPKSRPISFWTTKNIYDYIDKYDLSYCDIYNIEGIENTGCIFCMFGVHFEDIPNRFQCLKQTHPKLWDYCINELNIKQVLEYYNIPYELKNKKLDVLS